MNQQVRDLNAQLLLAQRERDRAMEENFKLRDKLLECAKECSECGGTAVVKIVREDDGKWFETECTMCLDIRMLLE